MAKKKERTELKKTNYVSTFALTGSVRLNDNAFALDQKSEKSDWMYSRVNLPIYCGEKHGLVYTQCMGGYSLSGNSKIYAHGKREDGSDDYSTRLEISFEDRKDPEIVKQVGRMALLNGGLQKDTKGKTVYENFISGYDLVQYMSDHLQNDMIVHVRGNIKYNFFNENVIPNYEITSIALSNIEDESEFFARFTQSMLIDENSKGTVDKETGELDVTGYVLEYTKTYDGIDITTKDGKGQIVPLPYRFVYRISDAMKKNPDMAKKAISKLFGIKKKGTVNQISVEGDLEFTGATVSMTVDDLTDDIKDLIAIGLMSEEDALATCATGGSRERKMVIVRPRIKLANNDDGTTTPVVQIFEEVYDEEDLDYFRNLKAEAEEESEKGDGDFDEAMNPPEVKDEEKGEEGEYDWLNDL